MIKRYFITFVMLLCSSLVYAETATQESPPLQITDQRNGAAGFALSYVATIVSVANTCKLEPSLSQATFDAFAKWHQRNGLYFEAVKGWIHYVGTQAMASQGKDAVSQFESKLIRDNGARGAETAKGFFANASRTTVCEKWIGLLNSPQSDLINEKNAYSKEFQELLDFYRSRLASGASR